MAVFTPGPWKVTAAVDRWGWRNYAINNGHRDGKHEANARLIAAGPELYDALQQCSFQLAKLVAASGAFTEDNARALDTAATLLARIEGKE